MRKLLLPCCAGAVWFLLASCLGLVVIARAEAPPAWSEVLAEDTRLKADVGWLEVGSAKTLYLYKPATGAPSRGTVILLHDLNGHADWPQVIRPLRELLPEHGWATFSLQLPGAVADGDPQAYFSAVADRITTAAQSIAKQSDQPILLLGVGTGASAGAWYLKNVPKNQLWGMVAISLRPLPQQTDQAVLEDLANLEKPVLEVYAEGDHPRVLEGVAQRRRLAARPSAASPADRRPPKYRQMLVEGSDADYAGQADVLTKRIRGWMQSQLDR